MTKDLLKEVQIFYHKTRKGDLLIQVTA